MFKYFDFEEVDIKSEEHIRILFKILNEREFNISHKETVKYEDHHKFVQNNKYRKWYLVRKKSKILGSFYITNNNYIAINLLTSEYKDYLIVAKYVLKNFKPLEEIKSFRNKYFLLNTNPNNKILLKALDDLKFIHIESSFLCKTSDT